MKIPAYLSPLHLFEAEVRNSISSCRPREGRYTAAALEGLPPPVRQFFRDNGWLGQQRESYAEIRWADSRIKLKPKGKWMSLCTRQYNFIYPPVRLAYMRAHLLGFIPFEGRDRYAEGQGHMLGVLGRLIRIFDEHNVETAEGAAIVLLAESLIIPGYALSPYLAWEAVDDRQAIARFRQGDIDVGGVFHFNEQGEYVRFTSTERPYKSPRAGFQHTPFSIDIGRYQIQDGLRYPSAVSATWHLPEGAYTYWEGQIQDLLFHFD
jgi:hypothetical protein